MLARLCAFVIWALVAATAVFWGLRLFVAAPSAPAHTVPVGGAAVLRGDLSRLLGAAPVAAAAVAAPPEAAARFRLLGVMAPRSVAASAASGAGVALIAVDGKPPKAYPVGARLDGEVMLQSVSLRAASIAMGPGQAPVLLELAPLPAPATGTLPALLSPVQPSLQAPLQPPAQPPLLPPPAAAPQATPPAQVPLGAPSQVPNRPAGVMAQ